MWTTLFLLVGLMIATAVIAYWSDNLGKKLGKKRVTLGGLRPKQTATLITIASSLVIMLVTFGTMLVVYKPLQDALLRFDRVLADKTRFERQNTLLSGDIERLKAQEDTLRTSINTAQVAADNAEKAKIAAVKSKTSAVKAKNAAVKSKNTAEKGEKEASKNARLAKRREETAKRGEATANRGAEVAHRDLETARSGLERTKSDLRVAKERLKPVQEQLKTAKESLKTAKENLKFAKFAEKAAKTAEKQAKTTEKTARNEATKAGRTVLAIEERVLEKERLVSELEKRETALQDSIADLKQQVSKYEQQLEQAKNRLTDFYVKPLLITSGESLAQQMVKPYLESAAIADLLRDLLAKAQQNVRRIGELNGRLGLKANILTQQVEIDNQNFSADANAQIDIIAKRWAQSSTPIVVRVVSARNHTIDEDDIEATIRILPLSTAYLRDETIATATVDGKRSDAQIFNQLLRLLNAGESVARSQKGVQPPQGGDNKFYAEDTNERVFEALNALKSLRSAASVNLRAAEDLTTTAPFKVRFEVLPAS